MKIDIYAHFMPQKVIDTYVKRVGDMEIVGMRPDEGPNMDWFDIELRIDLMNKFPDLVEILIPTGQPLERHASPKDGAYIAQVYNDELAELLNKYPDKFVAAVACLSLSDVPAALKEIDRAINELGFRGIYIQTPVNGRSMDSAEFLPVYERMSSYNLPIWIHPLRHHSFADYTDEDESKYGLFHAFGWPYETTIAMGRIVCSGLLNKYPNLKFITHHAGAMVPFLAQRIPMLNCSFGQGRVDPDTLFQQFRMFYNDTAIYGNTPALMCAHAFFGTEHLLFGSDVPYGPGVGEGFLRATIEAIEGMNIPEADKRKIFADNAKEMLDLKI
jgi:aminocarboxymuconate-semialdehyde decarboxylase